MWTSLGTVYFRVFPKELPSLLKSCHLLLLSSAEDQRPAIPYTELSLWACAAGWESWCYSSATFMLTIPSGKQQQHSSLCKCWGPPAVLKVKLKASKEVYPCTNGVPSGLWADLLLVSNPSWALISSPPLPGIPYSYTYTFFISQPLGLECFLASSILVEGNLGYSHWWEIPHPWESPRQRAAVHLTPSDLPFPSLPVAWLFSPRGSHHEQLPMCCCDLNSGSRKKTDHSPPGGSLSWATTSAGVWLLITSRCTNSLPAKSMLGALWNPITETD